jgi:ribosomal protein S18 acetylase RimI-like enzyme
MSDTPMPLIRPYQACDRDDAYDVCIRTGAAGQDARGRFSTDDLIPDIYTGPYLELAPEHAYVLDNGDRAVGYIIGTANTSEFVAAYRTRWLPRLRERYEPPTPASPVTDEQDKLEEMFSPERMLRPELLPHPAHLHINLLPEYQGAGHGRDLMGTFLASAAAAGAASCHLTVRSSNTGALRFYDKLGWRRVEVEDPGTWVFLARPTT